MKKWGNRSHTNSDDGWDWGWLYYLSTVILKMTEVQFWKCTPIKLNSLFAIHKKVEGIESENENNEQGYIDDILF